MIRTAALVVTVVITLAGWASAQVTLRGGALLGEQVTAVNGQGIVAGKQGEVVRTIPWDMVREVGGEHAGAAALYKELADKSWRARQRWLRGDYAMAEPLLDEIFSVKVKESGPLTLRVAEGLLRCRLVRGDQAGAVLPWLTAMRMQGAEVSLPAEVDSQTKKGSAGVASAAKALAAVIDPDTALCPALPPIWINTEGTAALAASLDELLRAQAMIEMPPAIRELTRLYARSAALDSQTPLTSVMNAPGAPAGTGSEDGEGPSAVGVKLVSLIVRSRDPDPAVRRAAQSRLASGLSADADTWKEAWRRAALGRSLLMESDEASKSEGLVHLLHLPARFKPTQPYLSGLAVIEASAELKRRGVTGASAATRLIADLKLEEPFHPALQAIASELPISNPAGAKP